MSVAYPDDYPKTREEALRVLASIRDEDIDYSDIPEQTEEQLAQFKPVGDKFIRMGERNIRYLNKLIREYEQRHPEKAAAL